MFYGVSRTFSKVMKKLDLSAALTAFSIETSSRNRFPFPMKLERLSSFLSQCRESDMKASANHLHSSTQLRMILCVESFLDSQPSSCLLL